MTVRDLRKQYPMGKSKISVLKGVDLHVRRGEMLSIVGQSGCGKSTLLHLLGTLDVPDHGSIRFEGRRIDNLSVGQRDVLRNRFIGMIFQFYHLLPELTTLENVLAPLMIRESALGYLYRRRRYVRAAGALLERVGLGHRLKHRPSELSGGEMQRVSIARALIGDPKILLADEPTGNLDANSAREILGLLRELNRERRLTIVMVTHDLTIAGQADRTIQLIDGVVSDPENGRAGNVRSKTG
ncbi:MAG TPA: ABC transporter ATP-binding protein [Planctomycetaceae bacterium]|nr:ABC transporter ATP-binding protein [Planctomycetaceae bacterium]